MQKIPSQRVNWKALKSSIPHKVQVSKDVFYEVCWIDNFSDPVVLGETRLDNKQIVLKNNQSNSETVKTFLHELAHAVSHEYDINLTETQVQAVERSFYFILKPGNVFKNEK